MTEHESANETPAAAPVQPDTAVSDAAPTSMSNGISASRPLSSSAAAAEDGSAQNGTQDTAVAPALVSPLEHKVVEIQAIPVGAPPKQEGDAPAGTEPAPSPQTTATIPTVIAEIVPSTNESSAAAAAVIPGLDPTRESEVLIPPLDADSDGVKPLEAAAAIEAEKEGLPEGSVPKDLPALTEVGQVIAAKEAEKQASGQGGEGKGLPLVAKLRFIRPPRPEEVLTTLLPLGKGFTEGGNTWSVQGEGFGNSKRDVSSSGGSGDSAAAPVFARLAFVDPRRYGGFSLNQSGGLGEPLNMIISGDSSPSILTISGLKTYLRSLGLAQEFLGLHKGGPQRAWLDPRGWSDELFLFRQVYSPIDHVIGTGVETLIGGNHIRVWQQQGTKAWFFAASKELPLKYHHMIIPDGYNIGRDLLVQKSQEKPGGLTCFSFNYYQTTVEYVEGLMSVGTDGVNHAIPVDGKVAVLTVRKIDRKERSQIKKDLKGKGR